MSDEIRTPRGRVLRLETDSHGIKTYEIRAAGVRIDVDYTGETRCRGFGISTRTTKDEALSWLDARADETVAALLPPGAIVVTEERVRDLAKVLVARVGPFCGEGNCGVCVTARDEFLSALRAGAQS